MVDENKGPVKTLQEELQSITTSYKGKTGDATNYKIFGSLSKIVKAGLNSIHQTESEETVEALKRETRKALLSSLFAFYENSTPNENASERLTSWLSRHKGEMCSLSLNVPKEIINHYITSWLENDNPASRKTFGDRLVELTSNLIKIFPTETRTHLEKTRSYLKAGRGSSPIGNNNDIKVSEAAALHALLTKISASRPPIDSYCKNRENYLRHQHI